MATMSAPTGSGEVLASIKTTVEETNRLVHAIAAHLGLEEAKLPLDERPPDLPLTP
jgi:hypothetical protein